MRVGTFCVLFCALVIFPSYIIEATPYGNNPEEFAIADPYGRINGNCLGTDQTGYHFCYMRRGCRNCEGGNSPVLCQYCKNYSNCRRRRVFNDLRANDLY